MRIEGEGVNVELEMVEVRPGHYETRWHWEDEPPPYGSYTIHVRTGCSDEESREFEIVRGRPNLDDTTPPEIELTVESGGKRVVHTSSTPTASLTLEDCEADVLISAVARDPEGVREVSVSATGGAQPASNTRMAGAHAPIPTLLSVQSRVSAVRAGTSLVVVATAQGFGQPANVASTTPVDVRVVSPPQDVPTISRVSPDALGTGDDITIRGGDLTHCSSPVEVVFSQGGNQLSSPAPNGSSGSRIRVEVPAGLSGGPANVAVRVGSLISAPAVFTVTDLKVGPMQGASTGSFGSRRVGAKVDCRSTASGGYSKITVDANVNAGVTQFISTIEKGGRVRHRPQWTAGNHGGVWLSSKCNVAGVLSIALPVPNPGAKYADYNLSLFYAPKIRETKISSVTGANLQILLDADERVALIIWEGDLQSPKTYYRTLDFESGSLSRRQSVRGSAGGVSARIVFGNTIEMVRGGSVIDTIRM